jgi:chromosome condensin MukBEF ATPase and DNA-binding subunit MukB
LKLSHQTNPAQSKTRDESKSPRLEEFGEDIEEQNDKSRIVQHTPRKQNLEPAAAPLKEQNSRFSIITAEYRFSHAQKEEENFSLTDFDNEE